MSSHFLIVSTAFFCAGTGFADFFSHKNCGSRLVRMFRTL